MANLSSNSIGVVEDPADHAVTRAADRSNRKGVAQASASVRAGWGLTLSDMTVPV